MRDKSQYYYCEKCKKTLKGTEFYMTNNLDKYPNGVLHQCKKCITLHVDNWDPSTYTWILQECDVPYVPVEWDALLDKYGKDKSKVTGTTVIGRYLSKMKLKQYKDYRWRDSQFLQQQAEYKAAEAMKRAGYGAAQITQTLDESRPDIPEEVEVPVYAEELKPSDPNYHSAGSSSAGEVEEAYVLDYTEEIDPEEEELVSQLTDEDKRYLRLKWGKTYKPIEWISLEKLYVDMVNSYDGIVGAAGSEDTLKLLCKASLKTNQLLDLGDVDGAQKMQKMYDSLMKSGKWTAAQNKADGADFISSIGELVTICEKQGFIPQYYIAQPNDKVDETIQDNREYVASLVRNEMNLGNLIDNAVKQMQIETTKAEDDDEDDEDEELQEIRRQIEGNELDDQDFDEFNEFLDSEAEEDMKDGS